MQPLSSSISTLAVATIYCIWRMYNQVEAQRGLKLRDRVTYMLWVAVDEMS